MGLIRDAIIRIEIVNTATDMVMSWGTGFLVGPNLVLTALHVVAERKTPLTLRPGFIRARFGGENASPTSPAEAVPNHWSHLDDWALLRLKKPPVAVHALPLARLSAKEKNRQWSTRGFPTFKKDGATFHGDVQSLDERAEEADVVQLFSHNVAAGAGAPVEGLSGAPVIVDDRVVGLLRWATLRQDIPLGGKATNRSEAGLLFACPIGAVLDNCEMLVDAGWPAATADKPVTLASTAQQIERLAGALDRVLRGGAANDAAAGHERAESIVLELRSLVGGLPAASDGLFATKLAAACLHVSGACELLLAVIAATAKPDVQEQAAVAGLADTLQNLFPHSVPWALSLELKRIIKVNPKITESACRVIRDPVFGLLPLPLFTRIDRIAARSPEPPAAPPLLTFAARLRPRVTALSQWLKEAAAFAGVDPKTLAKNAVDTDDAGAPQICIVVAPHVADPAKTLTIRGSVFWGEQHTDLSFSRSEFPRSEVSQLAAEINQAVGRESPELLAAGPRIELFLPFEAIANDVDARPCGSSRRPTRLGTTFPFAVRSWNRFFDVELKARLVPSWSSLLEGLPGADVTWIDDAMPSSDLFDHLERTKPCCVAISLRRAVESGGNDVCTILEDIIYAGIPAAVCLREPAGDAHAARGAITPLAGQGQIEQLPNGVFTLRKGADSEAHLGRHVTLLWDLAPPHPKLSQQHRVKPID